MKDIDVIKKLSLLTTVDEQYLKKLFDKIPWIICDGISNEMVSNENPVITLSLGYGNLIISIVDDQIKYKFVPSKEFEDQVIDTVCNGFNSLAINLEKSLANKLTTIYKDLF